MSGCGAEGLKKTVLNTAHSVLGGTLVDFGGWQMPLWYESGAIKEHLAVITGAGLFDTSHMTVLLAEGPALGEFLNFAITKDLNGLAPGRAAYGLILNEAGEAVDDTLAYPLAEGRFGLVLNACMGPKVIKHLKALPGAADLKLTDLSGSLAKIDLQGPASFKILKNFLARPDEVFAQLPYFSFKGDFDLNRSSTTLGDGTPIMLSRTGYTGELGFEIFLPADMAVDFWSKLLEAGRPHGLRPCGLAARDSLRAGAVLPLSHQDIGPWPFINNPWSWALPWNGRGGFSKNFLGAETLNPKTADHTLPFVGFDPRKIETGEALVIYENQAVGRVLTAVADMAIGRVEGRVRGLADPGRPEGWQPKGLVCGFIKINHYLEPGTIVTLKDARRELKVEISLDIRPYRSARRPLHESA